MTRARERNSACDRERERGEFFRARQRVSFRAHTHTQRPTRRKKNLPGQKKKRSPPLVSIPTFAPTGKVARIFPSRSFSLALDGGQTASIDRSRRARAAKWDIGSLGSRTPPVVKRDDPQNRSREKWEGGRDRSNPTPRTRAHRKLLERFCFRRRTRERKRDDDDDDDDAPSSCTRSTDSPRFFCGLLDCSSRVRFAFAFVSSSRRVPRPPRRRRLRCERFEVALPFESLLLHRLLLRMYSSVREGESRA